MTEVDQTGVSGESSRLRDGETAKADGKIEALRWDMDGTHQ